MEACFTRAGEREAMPQPRYVGRERYFDALCFVTTTFLVLGKCEFYTMQDTLTIASAPEVDTKASIVSESVG